MPRHTYPFVRFEYEDGSIDAHGRTVLPFRITNVKTAASAVVWGLVDTGADATLFPSDLAVALGHSLKGDGVKSSMTSGIEQRPVSTYKHTFRLELLNSTRKRTVWAASSVQVDCAESNPPVLLGVRDFLCNFKLTVNYLSENLSLAW